jgi:uncharacterized protein
MLIGVISDTHGFLPAEVHDAFAGIDAILHAGDVGSCRVLHELAAIAPVTAVRGNMDADDCRGALTPLANTVLGGVRVLVCHRMQDVPEPLPDGVALVICGHTHVPMRRQVEDVLYLNPGSASRPDGDLPGSVAILTVLDGRATAEIVGLDG